MLGTVAVLAEFVDCSEEDLTLCAIQHNNAHGLPLTLFDRKRAAKDALRKNPSLSDRWVAGMCGLSHSTVAKLRANSESARSSPAVDDSSLPNRLGRDGRRRSQHPAIVRERISDALAAAPGATLRVIAAQVGVSPETVRNVRRRLQTDEEPLRASLKTAEPVKSEWPPPKPYSVANDPAFQAVAPLGEFVAWFDQRHIGLEWRQYLESIPMGRIYEVADDCKRRAKTWRDFAEALEDRAARSRVRIRGEVAPPLD
jgi:hypothetical protein